MVDISVDMMGRDSGRAAQFPARGGPGQRRPFIQVIVRPEIYEAGEDIGQIDLGIDAVEFAGLYQGSGARRIARMPPYL